MSNRRSADRAQTIYYSRVIQSGTGELIGRLVDISDRGMMIVGDAELEPGEKLALRIELPRALLNREHIDLQGDVRWCQRDVNPDFWATGFEFHGVADEDALLISHLRQAMSFEHQV